MRTIFIWASSRPRTALAFALLVSVSLSTGIVFLKIDPSMERLLSSEDHRVEYLNDVRENFGDNPVVLAIARPPELFDASILTTLKEYGESLAGANGIENVSSLFTLDVPVSKGGRIHAAKLLSEIPESDESLASLRTAILNNTLLRDNLVNSSGDTLVYFLFLEPEGKSVRDHEVILAGLEEVRKSFQERLPPQTELALVGVPVVKNAVQQNIRWDLAHLGPVALLVIGVVIFLFYRSLTAVLLPLLTGIMSVTATLGFMGFAGYKISIFLSTIVVLILVLGCTEDLHILSEYFDRVEEGEGKLKAIQHVGRYSGLALMLTSVTTVVSFASLAFTDLPGLRHFAVSCAFGMAINFLITILVLPAMLSLLPIPPFSPKQKERGLLRKIQAMLNLAFLTRRKSMITVIASFLLFAGAGASRLEINTDYLRFFPPNSALVRDYYRFADWFKGGSFVTVTFETHRRQGVAKPENLAKLYRFHDFLNREFGHALGYINLLDEFQKANTGESLSPTNLPTERALAVFAESIPRKAMAPFLDYDGSRAAIRVQTEAPTSSDILNLETLITTYAAENLGADIEVRVTGERIIVAHLTDLLMARLIPNLAILALVVTLLISLMLRSLTMGIIAILPNLFPIVTTFGAMGWLGIPLSMGTFPVSFVAFGIAVDATIHFLLRFSELKKSPLSSSAAVSETLARELRPVLATSTTVAVGYLVMALSPFRINSEVGILFALATFSALLADLVLTPILLSYRK